MATTANDTKKVFQTYVESNVTINGQLLQQSATGININGISSILSAITTYKNKVAKACDISAKKSLIENAIKGSSSEAKLKQFTTSIQTAMTSHLKKMNDYEKILNDVKASYKKNDTSNASFNVKVDGNK
jgi:hypothetical protein